MPGGLGEDQRQLFTAVAGGQVVGPRSGAEDLADGADLRAIQELLGNAARHSQASQVKIVLDMGEDRIRVSVDDNGRGFDPVKVTVCM